MRVGPSDRKVPTPAGGQWQALTVKTRIAADRRLRRDCHAVSFIGAVILFSDFAMAATAPPSFDPVSVPERLQALEGRIAYIKVPSQEEAPLDAAEGAVLKGSVPAEVVTSENTTSIPIELAQREMQFDRLVQGYISEADMVAFMHKQAASFVMLKDGTAVRIIAPQVDDGFATQILPLTGDMSKAELGGEMHLWVNSCFLRFASAANQRLFHRGKTCR